MTKTELLNLLFKLQDHGDTESAHKKADEALLVYINDPNITEAFNALEKWYA